MFEHTLAGSMPRATPVRVGPVTVALVLHAGVLLALAAVSLLTWRPIPPPNVPLIIFDIQSAPAVAIEPERPAGARARRSSGDSRPALVPPEPPKPPETTQPELVPDTIPDVATSSPPPIVDSLFGEGEEEGSGPGNGPPGGNGFGPGDESGEGGPGTRDGTGNGPVALGPTMVAPRLLVKVQPDYPSFARKARLEGQVVLRAVVGPDGSVTNVEVVRSTNPVFDAAAMDAVRRWRYSPPTQGGRPVSVWFDVVVKFTLR